jgi:hypothetical protein
VDFEAAAQAVGGAQGHGANSAAAEVGGDFAGQIHGGPVLLGLDLDGVVDFGELVFGELGVEGGADDLGDLAGGGHVVIPRSGFYLVLGWGIVLFLHEVATGRGKRET